MSVQKKMFETFIVWIPQVEFYLIKYAYLKKNNSDLISNLKPTMKKQQQQKRNMPPFTSFFFTEMKHCPHFIYLERDNSFSKCYAV